MFVCLLFFLHSDCLCLFHGMFFSQLFFQGKAIEEEEAFVLFVRKNALQILIPKYGLEGTVFMNKQDVSGFTYNEQVFFSQTFFQYIVSFDLAEKRFMSERWCLRKSKE